MTKHKMNIQNKWITKLDNVNSGEKLQKICMTFTKEILGTERFNFISCKFYKISCVDWK